MELGEKLRQARLEAGLSQRQLCGEQITRNMLSRIENGAAKPSMTTLQYLAGKLGKSVSYFLEETAVVSSNLEVMAAAREQYAGGDYNAAAGTLERYREPDPLFDRERQLLHVLIHLALAQKAVEENRERYALELLEKAKQEQGYCREALERQRLLLLGRLKARPVSDLLPSLDEELLIRAEEALEAGKHPRAVALLEAVEDQTSPRWQLLRGEACLAEGAYASAAEYFQGAEAAYPGETLPKLELCYRELGDFKRAYEYACKQR